MEAITKNIPALALRGLNAFPRQSVSFDVERAISIRALERAMETGQEIFLVTQREIGVELPEQKDLYEIGTVSRVTQMLRVSGSIVRVMIEGQQPLRRHGTRTEAMLRQTYVTFGEYSELIPKLPNEVYAGVMETTDPGYLADFIAQNITLRYQDKQTILEELRPVVRLGRRAGNR